MARCHHAALAARPHGGIPTQWAAQDAPSAHAAGYLTERAEKDTVVWSALM